MAHKKTIIALLGLSGLIAVAVAVLSQQAENPAPLTKGSAAPGPEAPARALDMVGMQYHALVIGISNYEHRTEQPWSNLRTPVNDATAMADILESDYGFNVTRLIDEDATREAMIKQLERLVTDLGPRDAALVYFAGHGHLEPTIRGPEGYWVPFGAPHRIGDEPALDEWLSNELIASFLDASPARHILVVADSCYGGSLALRNDGLTRGEPAHMLQPSLQPFRRAMQLYSRFLISSGSNEKVLDGTGQHSVFANKLISYLRNPLDGNIFSASTLGQAILNEVSTMTLQLPQVTKLNMLPSHDGGDFIFVHKDAEWREPPALPDDDEALAALSVPAELSSTILLSDALVLRGYGATNAARKVLERSGATNLPAFLQKDIQVMLRVGANTEQRRLSQLVEGLELLNENDTPDSPYAFPRIVACIGPEAADESVVSKSREKLYQMSLSRALMQHSGISVMARDQLEELLESLEFGVSDLTDQRATLRLGQVLPASTLIKGDIITLEDGSEEVFISLYDVETMNTFAVFSETFEQGKETVFSISEKLAGEISRSVQKHRPLEAQILTRSNNLYYAGIGRFHGVSTSAAFNVMARSVNPGGAYGDVTDVPMGLARIQSLEDMRGAFSIDWKAGTEPPSLTNIWIREP